MDWQINQKGDAMQLLGRFTRLLLVSVLGTTALGVTAGQVPGVPTPWNGPWGAGYLNGESYNPLSNPYIGSGYPVGGPPPYGPPGPGGGFPQQSPQQIQPQPRPLPGGGYLLPPGAGGGMLPGAYANH